MPLTHTLFVTTAASEVKPITVKSPAFNNMGRMPKKYCGDGSNVSPALLLGKLPVDTKSLVLIVEDPNAPVDTWVHWLVWDIAPTGIIKEGAIPGVEGLNAFQRHHYQGPTGSELVRYYYFKVYALNTLLNLHNCSVKYQVMKAMKDHVIGYGELTGFYTSSKNNKVQTAIRPEIYY
jgi:Raf kinase inhibitor-like YbhB/YbcL family protein